MEAPDIKILILPVIFFLGGKNSTFLFLFVQYSCFCRKIHVLEISLNLFSFIYCLFSFSISNLHENGLLLGIKKKIFKGKSQFRPHDKLVKPVLKLSYLFGAFIFYGSGMALSGIYLTVLCLSYKIVTREVV